MNNRTSSIHQLVSKMCSPMLSPHENRVHTVTVIQIGLKGPVLLRFGLLLLCQQQLQHRTEGTGRKIILEQRKICVMMEEGEKEIFKSLVCYEIYASIWCRMVYNALKQAQIQCFMNEMQTFQANAGQEPCCAWCNANPDEEIPDRFKLNPKDDIWAICKFVGGTSLLWAADPAVQTTLQQDSKQIIVHKIFPSPSTGKTHFPSHRSPKEGPYQWKKFALGHTQDHAKIRDHLSGTVSAKCYLNVLTLFWEKEYAGTQTCHLLCFSEACAAGKKKSWGQNLAGTNIKETSMWMLSGKTEKIIRGISLAITDIQKIISEDPPRKEPFEYWVKKHCIIRLIYMMEEYPTFLPAVTGCREGCQIARSKERQETSSNEDERGHFAQQLSLLARQLSSVSDGASLLSHGEGASPFILFLWHYDKDVVQIIGKEQSPEASVSEKPYRILV
ncbi:hypothetical protein Anapl_06811 [Anas platyrhynchos]|uniref:Uncharacterized protein n=1 Tax=Anas platyrhynchos TaxID=8839 RepID=R0M4M9_ANAPL|nr:hypothetical protein Anapl_06811 [Anas platyrhynchos]